MWKHQNPDDCSTAKYLIARQSVSGKKIYLNYLIEKLEFDGSTNSQKLVTDLNIYDYN